MFNDERNLTKFDKQFIRRCIELSKLSVAQGDAPFGCLIAIDDQIIVESLNNSHSRISDHAEIIAMHDAHMKLGTNDLCACTLYSNCEPCPMCSFMIREYKIKRVVFSIPSKSVGGYSKWPILQDKGLENLNPFFAKPPMVISGYLENEANEVMHNACMTMFGDDEK